MNDTSVIFYENRHQFDLSSLIKTIISRENSVMINTKLL